MNRAEFMRQLESLLQNIPVTEREEALQYYNDYFDDAGGENEQRVIEALGNPARVAENIRRDLLESGYGEAPPKKVTAADRQIIEYGKAETPPPQPMQEQYERKALQEESRGAARSPEGYSAAQPGRPGQPGQPGRSGWVLLMIIILVLACSPIWGGILGTLITLVACWFVLILCFGLVAGGLLIGAVILFVVGVQCIVVDPLSGVALIGAGLLMGSISILFLMLTVALAGIVTPAIFKGIVRLFRKKPRRTGNMASA